MDAADRDSSPARRAKRALRAHAPTNPRYRIDSKMTAPYGRFPTVFPCFQPSILSRYVPLVRPVVPPVFVAGPLRVTGLSREQVFALTGFSLVLLAAYLTTSIAT